MGDRVVPIRPEEQYPLLKVDAAGGDNGGVPKPNLSQTTQGWGVTCTKKPSWLSRWPEFISACWMSLILFGISFLVFYVLGMGMGAYRHQQFIFVKCNDSKPASNVYFHQIVPRGGVVPFSQYSNFLSYMCIRYPLLRFKVYFLIDDSYPSSQRGPRHSRFINKLIPYNYGLMTYKMDDNTKEAMNDFQKRYINVNLTIMSLSKYMSLSTTKSKWKHIPHAILPFYIRVFAIWEDSGIGMDLNIFNNYFNSRHLLDRKITAILKQHNDGISVKDYSNALNKIEREDDTAFFSIFYGMLNTVLNQTRSFLNKSNLYIPIINSMTAENNSNQPLVRTHRARRAVLNDPIIEDNVFSINKNNSDVGKQTIDDKNNSTDDMKDIETQKVENDSKPHINEKLNNSSGSFVPLVVVYDLSFVSDTIGPSYLLEESNEIGPEFIKPSKVSAGPSPPSPILSLDMEGHFIASSEKLHPFLGSLLNAACLKVPPKFAIQDVLLTRCSSFFRNDVYCNNLYIL